MLMLLLASCIACNTFADQSKDDVKVEDSKEEASVLAFTPFLGSHDYYNKHAKETVDGYKVHNIACTDKVNGTSFNEWVKRDCYTSNMRTDNISIVKALPDGGFSDPRKLDTFDRDKLHKGSKSVVALVHSEDKSYAGAELKEDKFPSIDKDHLSLVLSLTGERCVLCTRDGENIIITDSFPFKSRKEKNPQEVCSNYRRFVWGKELQVLGMNEEQFKVVSQKIELKMRSKLEFEMKPRLEKEIRLKLEPEITSKLELEIKPRLEKEIRLKLEPEIRSELERQKQSQLGTTTEQNPVPIIIVGCVVGAVIAGTVIGLMGQKIILNEMEKHRNAAARGYDGHDVFLAGRNDNRTDNALQELAKMQKTDDGFNKAIALVLKGIVVQG